MGLPKKKAPQTQRDFKSEATMRAIEVIGDEKQALRWMGTPVRALNYATPISLLNDLKGERAVLAILDKLEHGVF